MIPPELLEDGLTVEEARGAEALLNGDPMKIVIVHNPGEADSVSRVKAILEQDLTLAMVGGPIHTLESKPPPSKGLWATLARLFGRKAK